VLIEGSRQNAGIFRYALNDTQLWPPRYPASEMMEGENVKASTTIFKSATTQGSASSPDPSSGACAAESKL